MLYLEDAAFLHSSVRLSEKVKVRPRDLHVLHTADERARHDLPPANTHEHTQYKPAPTSVTAARFRERSLTWLVESPVVHRCRWGRGRSDWGQRPNPETPPPWPLARRGYRRPSLINDLRTQHTCELTPRETYTTWCVPDQSGTSALVPLQSDPVPAAAAVCSAGGRGQRSGAQVKGQVNLAFHQLDGQEVSLQTRTRRVLSL